MKRINHWLSITLVVLLFMLSFPVDADNISEQVEYYYHSKEPLSISTTIEVFPYDVPADPFDVPITNNSLGYYQTTYESGWIGALPLDRGTVMENLSKLENTVNGIFSFSIDQLSLSRANISIVFETFAGGESYSFWGLRGLFEGTVSQGDIGNGSISTTLVWGANYLENGSLYPDLGYHSLLNVSSSYYYSRLSVSFTTFDRSIWNDTATVTVTYQGEHNPEFFALMKSRIVGDMPPSDRSSITTTKPSTTSSTPLSIASSTGDGGANWIFGGASMLILLLLYQKRKFTDLR